MRKGLKKETVSTTKQSVVRVTATKRVISACLILLGMVFAFTLTICVALYLLPVLSLHAYELAGLAVQMNLNLSLVELPVASLVTMTIMWIVPTAFVLIIISCIHWQILKAVGRKLKAWWNVVFYQELTMTDDAVVTVQVQLHPKDIAVIEK